MTGRHKATYKPAFVERYKEFEDWDVFSDYTLRFLQKSIRVNTLKGPVQQTKKNLKSWTLTQIPWCKQGFRVEHKEQRRDIGNTREHALGYIYVQEAASMIPALILKPQPGDYVLDMCSAPGSKTTQMAAMMENKGRIVANELTSSRIKALGINVQRCGVENTIITHMNGLSIQGVQFDKILVDAPCSGIGTARRRPYTLQIWNLKLIKRLSHLQKRLIVHAYSLLKPGGSMVYSTCSVDPEENEGVVSHLLAETDAILKKASLPGLKTRKPLTTFAGTTYDKEVTKCLSIHPQDNDSEGFFVALLHKPDRKQ